MKTKTCQIPVYRGTLVNKWSRVWQNMFAITRILYIELFSLYFTITGAGNMVCSVEDFNI